MTIPYDENTPLYGSIGIDIYLKLIRHKYSSIDINELLEYAEMEPYQVKDAGHFFSQRQINRFMEKLIELSGNQNIAREAGRFSASPNASSVLWRSVLGLISPVRYYELLGKYANKITKSSKYESKRLSLNKVEITVTPYPGTKEQPFQCENRMGYWDAISTFYKLKPPKISHPECIFKGDSRCRYIVSWPKSPVTLLTTIRNLSLILSGLTCLFFTYILLFINSSQKLQLTFTIIFSLFVTFTLIINWLLKKIETNNLLETISLLRGSSDELMKQIEINYENSLLINETAQALAKESEKKGLFNEIISVLHKRLDYDRILVMMANTDKTRLVYQAGYGYTDQQYEILESISFHLDKPGSKGLLAVSFHEKKPKLLNDIDEIKEDLSARSYTFSKQMGVKSIICCPIVYENESLGVLAVDNIVSKRPLLQSDMNLLMGIAHQIAARIHNINIETHLRQIQKMEAVGNLAGGVAHDFNNILTTILGYSQMLSIKIPHEDPMWKMVDNIHHAGIKASSLTQQLLAFSRKQVMEMEVTNLNIIVEDMHKMLSRLIGENIIMKLYLSDKVGNITADPGQIGQILMNLAVNARDAMQDGGRLTIETSGIFLDEHYATVRSDVKPGLYSMLSVSDTGTGMAPDVRDKIFEPFFTTKELGKGTGLGLSTVYGIVKQHNGHIHVYSEEGHGTSFKIYFPVTEANITEHDMSKHITMANGTENILVVDDDESIRTMIVDTLQPLGYTTLDAACGSEALEKYSSATSKIDLVISDVIMPGINGRKLVDTLISKQPDLKVILISGYTDNVIAHDKDLDAGYTLLNKPLLPVALANKIREVLDQQ